MNPRKAISKLPQVGATLKCFSILLALILLTSGCSGAPGASAETGTNAWVEYPYEGSILPLAPVTLVVYASDPAGISYIHIKVNGQSLPAYAASPMTADGNTRLVRIDYAWTPPGEGEYLVEAVGVNAAGASGGSSSTRFCIVTCASSGPTPTPAPDATETPTPAPAETPTQTAFPGTSIQFWASPPYINAGECTTLNWDVSGAQQVTLGGTAVNASGSQQACLCETSSYTLNVTGLDGQIQSQTLRVDVYGSCAAPVTEAPPQPPPPPQPPADTSGPTVNAVYAVWEGCAIYGQAEISDPSGVSWAEFHYNLNGQGWAWILMNQSGSLWTSQVGVQVTDGMSTPVGSMVYKVRTLDSLNNETWSGTSILEYVGCGGMQ